MNKKILVLIIVNLLLAIVAGAGVNSKINTGNQLVANELQNNKAAQELATMNITVTYEQLGTDANNNTVRGQTQFYGDGSIIVVLDCDVDPNSYDANAILYHEMGHIVAYQNGTENTEANADAYAASKGYDITDAYNGVK